MESIGFDGRFGLNSFIQTGQVYTYEIPMCNRVRIIASQTHTRLPNGWRFYPISIPMGTIFVPYPYPNRGIPHGLAGIGSPLTSLVLPHFGLWKYLYHCRPRMAGGQHQLVGGASLEMRRGRKTEYLEIPLKDSIKGWRLEWFIVENHGNSLPPRSGRQPDVRTPSWTESPTDQEVAEAGALLAEVGLLKERGLTAEAVVADFVFKNIQPLKDRAYPAYLYRGLADPTRVTNRRILAVDLVSRLEMILRGKVSNVGAPIAYSAWNLPPSKAFTHFVSNPPVADGSLGLRVRPSAEEVSVLVASIGEIPDDERQVHFEVPLDPNDAEINAMLDMLAEDSSDAAPAGTLAVAPLPEAGTTLDVQRPVSVRPRRPCRANQLDLSADEQKKKKRRLRQVSSLDQGAGPSVPVAEEVPMPEFTDANPNGCTPSVADPNGVLPVLLMKTTGRKKMRSL
jgi:hypothetical protein